MEPHNIILWKTFPERVVCTNIACSKPSVVVVGHLGSLMVKNLDIEWPLRLEIGEKVLQALWPLEDAVTGSQGFGKGQAGFGAILRTVSGNIEKAKLSSSAQLVLANPQATGWLKHRHESLTVWKAVKFTWLYKVINPCTEMTLSAERSLYKHKDLSLTPESHLKNKQSDKQTKASQN